MLGNMLIGLPTMPSACCCHPALFPASQVVDQQSLLPRQPVRGGRRHAAGDRQSGANRHLGRCLSATGEFKAFDEAFYHSAVNFATLGYGDIVMSGERKLLGPLKSVNGVLMIGLSTSVLLNGLQRAIRETLHARGEDDEL